MISKQRRACVAGSASPTVFPSGPIGAVPPTDTNGPTRTARENPMRSAYGFGIATARRSTRATVTPALRGPGFVTAVVLGSALTAAAGDVAQAIPAGYSRARDELDEPTWV